MQSLFLPSQMMYIEVEFLCSIVFPNFFASISFLLTREGVFVYTFSSCFYKDLSYIHIETQY